MVPASVLGDACTEGISYPAFLAEGVDPNLLMIIDNSASMYDLAYVPEVASEQGYCYDDSYIESSVAAPAWTNATVYAAGAVVSDGDNWYRTEAGGTSSGTGVADDVGVTDWEEVPLDYVGYFESGSWYVYNTGQDEFEMTATASADCDAAGGTKYSNDDVCIRIDSSGAAPVVAYFAARGRYLNWASVSKFDIEKKVLTGGKYAGNQLILESRGCMNETFIKQTGVEDAAGTPFFLTLGIISDTDAVSNYLTRIEIYNVTANGFQAADCQAAIDEFSDPSIASLGTVKSLTTDCLDPLGTGLIAKQSAFNHIMQECWYFNKHGVWEPGAGTVISMKNDCEAVYNSINPPVPPQPDEVNYLSTYAPDVQSPVDVCYGVYGTLQGYVGRCWEPTYSSGGIICLPKTCRPGLDLPTELLVDPATDHHSADKFCDSGTSLWYYCNGNYNASQQKCTGSPARWEMEIYCDPAVIGATIVSVDWTDDINGTYVESGLFTDQDDCVEQSLRKWCANLDEPAVVDPTDAMSSTGSTYNVPAILMDSALESQLGDPLKTMKGLIEIAAVPTGLLHEYSADIRMGAMAFNDGPVSECAPIEQPPGSGRYVANLYDCLIDKGSDITATSLPDPAQRDGAHVVTYIAKDAAQFDALIAGINNIEAITWTPTAEAYFNAIGYYTQNTALRFDSGDCIMDPDYSSYPAWTAGTAYAAGDIVYDATINKLYKTYSAGTSSSFLPDGVTPATELSHDYSINWQPFDPVIAYCQKNNILILTDGASTADQNSTMVTGVTTYPTQDEAVADTYDCGSLEGSTLLDDLAYYAYSAAIYPTANFLDENNLPVTGDNIRVYIVSTGTLRAIQQTGLPAECESETLLTSTAENGYDTDTAGNPLGQLYSAENPAELEEEIRNVFNDIRAGMASGSASSVISSSRSGEGAIYQAIFWPRFVTEDIRWIGDVHALHIDAYGRIYEDTDGDAIFNPSLDLPVLLYYDEGLGRTMACNDDLNATGDGCLGTPKEVDEVHYLWSAADWLADVAPNDSSSNLDIITNRASYISNEKKRYVYTWNDLDADGVVDTATEWLPFESATDWATLSSTVSGGRGPIPLDFGVQTIDEVKNIVDWIRGYDGLSVSGADDFLPDLDGDGSKDLRSRQRDYDFDLDGTSSTITWRLADVIHSTPMAVTRPAESFHLLYRDNSYAEFAQRYNERRHVIYYGSNGGMLHAVNGGFYQVDTNRFCRSVDCQSEATSPELGAELWSYVPYNLLPHLKCLMNPEYKHKYYVDLRPRIFDAKIFEEEVACTSSGPLDPNCIHPNGWGTIMMAGMRFGGAPIDANTIDADGDGAADAPADPRKFVSAYIIFDITNPDEPPQLLGEMTADASTLNLGYTTVNPTMVSMKDSTDQYWYLVFGSGPTETDGTSTQNASVAVFPVADLTAATPKAFQIPDAAPLATNEAGRFQLPDAESFVSDMTTVDFELQNEYKSDVVYFGTVSGDWGGWDGKMYRLVTREVDGSGIQLVKHPHEWSGILGTNPNVLIDAERPVTGAATVGTDGKNIWVYFGSGRYIHRADKSDVSSNAQDYFFGIKEPRSWGGAACTGTFTWEEVWKPDHPSLPVGTPDDRILTRVDEFTVNAGITAAGSQVDCPFPPGCPDNGLPSTTFEDLRDYITGTGTRCEATPDLGTGGWYRYFEDDRERNLGKSALIGGLLVYTSYQPFENVCLPEGLGSLYGLYYQTGTAWYKGVFHDVTSGPVDYKVSIGRGLATTPNIHLGSQEGGTAFAQTSTGAIPVIDAPNLPAQKVKTGREAWRDITLIDNW